MQGRVVRNLAGICLTQRAGRITSPPGAAPGDCDPPGATFGRNFVMGERPTIYHGTPMTPRAALLDVCTGRAMCVSFFRPDDVEAVEAISPAIMFRQRGVFVLEAGAAQWTRVGNRSRLGALLRMAGAAIVPSRSMGRHSRYAGRTFPAQRRALERLAVRTEGRAAVAHGRADRSLAEAVRSIRPCVLGLDRGRQGYRLSGLSRAHGGSGSRIGQPLARHSHDARHRCCLRLPVRISGRHNSSAERVAV